MENKRRHFVLVHGACHGAWCWYKLSALLKSAGHKVTAMDLAASGVHSSLVHEVRSISDYFEPLMEVMASLSEHERVILVGHSMGGVSISAAMERFPKKVSVAVFTAALMPGPEIGFTTLAEEYARRLDSAMDTEYRFDEGSTNPPTSLLFGSNFMSSKLYQLSPPQDLALAKMLVRPIRLFRDPALLKGASLTRENYGSVRRVYVICDQDNVIKQDFQRWMIEKNTPNEVEVISGSDHMPMFSRPHELCSCLQRFAERYG